MKTYFSQLKTLGKRLSVVFFLYTLCRILFYFFNRRYFSDAAASDLFISFLYGIRFDLTVISWSNSLFILLSILPVRVFFSKWYQLTLKCFYMLTNAVFLLFNCIDFAYFGFTNRRSGADIFNQIFRGQTDVMMQIPDYFRDFWSVILLYLFFIFLLFFLWSKIKLHSGNTTPVYTVKNSFSFVFLFALCSGSLLLGVRGGVQYIPLQIVDAGKFVPPKMVPIVLNTPFTIVRSLESTQLEELRLVSNESAFNYIRPVQHFNRKVFQKKNIVVLILEGFSKEYTRIGRRKSLTPFLDSLMKVSLVFTNAWANGKQSIEGIPAVLSAVPSLMNNPYINSGYAANRVNSFPQLLKQKGYTTAFFHGGKNGTMNFDAYAKIAGFDYYFGMNEYRNDADFDGNWGIWDEPYLQYCVKQFSRMKTPFFTSVFTLSSHHPFKIPEKYRNTFPKNGLECSESVGYTDNALRKFFDTAKKQKWFSDTWFVIVPDHTGISADAFYANSVGQHAIPIVFYSGDGLFRGENNTLMQQIDILPSIMDTLGYDRPFFSFGKSVFRDSQKHFALFYENGNYFLINDSMSFVLNNHKVIQAFRYSTDSSLAKNINHNNPGSIRGAEFYHKNFLQLYHHSLNNNSAFSE